MARVEMGNQKCLKGKILITGILRVLTGMHIGGNSDFAPIGSVDSPFIRDPLTHKPIIPGSSVKGKMRTLLAKSLCKGYILNKINEDDITIARLFGMSNNNGSQPARLQFVDLFVTDKSSDDFMNADTDTYMGEVKFENTISRMTAVANPRQIERVPAGAEFDFKLVYNIENEDELDEDMETLAKGFTLLQTDYLGGHGSRGYGRIKLYNFKIQIIGNNQMAVEQYQELFERSNIL